MSSPIAEKALIIRNALLFDGVADDLREGITVVIEGGRITEISAGRVTSQIERQIDLRGKFLMPGLIDAHFHAYGVSMDVTQFDHMPPTLLAHHGARMLGDTLLRGFTTVRDAGGADFGLAHAVELGLIPGPRIFFAGKSLSQTGGHGDLRRNERLELCSCGYSGTLSVVVDGVDEVRKAARDELRQGAHQIKLHISGGVLSPNDPIWMPQFSDAEIVAAVEEAATRRTYVMAHAHTADAALRCVRLGVRTIEHGTLIDAKTARAVAESDSYVVPTLAIIDRALKFGKDAGMREASLTKMRDLGRQSLEAFDHCVRAGVKIGFGTDLLGVLQSHQNHEFILRGELTTAISVLKSATSVNAAILNQSGDIGTISPGARADLLVIDGNPLRDLALLADPERFIKLIMKDGAVQKNTLNA